MRLASTAVTACLAATLQLSYSKSVEYIIFSDGEDLVERVDPIVNPDSIGLHTHVVFGSNAFNSTATTDSLRSDTTCSTGGSNDPDLPGPRYDRSAYWTPALYGKALNGSGYVYIHQIAQKVYYFDDSQGKGPYFGDQETLNFPPGNFHLIAGWPDKRAPNASQPNVHDWDCHVDEEQIIKGVDGAFPEIPAGGCPGVDDTNGMPGLMLSISFPHCVDASGKNFSYSGECPSENPFYIPSLKMEIFFKLDKEVADVLEPNSLAIANGDATGHGMHADFLNGWDTDGIATRLRDCVPTGEDLYANLDGYTGCGYEPYPGAPARKDCKLQSEFEEDVGLRGVVPALPGHNPVSEDSPSDM